MKIVLNIGEKLSTMANSLFLSNALRNVVKRKRTDSERKNSVPTQALLTF